MCYYTANIFIKIIKELEPKQKSALSIKCHSVYSVLDILYVFVKVGIELEKCIVLAKISKKILVNAGPKTISLQVTRCLAHKTIIYSVQLR